MAGEWRIRPITDRQKRLILAIRENAGINGALPLPEFTGKTMGEASDWIDKNYHLQFETMDNIQHEDYGERM